MMSASRKKEKGKKSRAPPPPPASAAQNPTSPPPGDARIIQMVKTPYTTVNHSYVDYSLVRPDPGETIRPRIEEMDFHQKLHSMLSTSEFSQSINWVWHGRAFRILVPSKFEKTACSEYFGHKRYSSFLYQLGLHGYKKLSAGKDRGAYYSPLLLRGLPHLTKYAPGAKEFRHLTQDPDNEPDFDVIHLIAPLPSDEHFGKPLTIEDIIRFSKKEGRSETAVMSSLLSLVPK